MKKTILGFAILGVYGIYSIGVRHQHPTIAPPSSLQGTKLNSTLAKTSSSAGGSGSSGSSAPPSKPKGIYRDGTYMGSVANAYYGNVQTAVTIRGGRIVDVKFLQYPNSHSTSVYINEQAMPYLKQETIQAQNSNVQIITGATFTSEAFIQSLQSALAKA
ncbi:FMN-binding protein [Patescibacteria group bacterium]|nr:FMN-binding protein [Patescibacteria group bacterium]